VATSAGAQTPPPSESTPTGSDLVLTSSPELTAKGIAIAENFQAWVHQLDPFLIQFTEQVGIRWYGLAYLCGFFVGYLLMVMIARRGLVAADGSRSLTEEKLGDFLLVIVLGTMLGGRFGYAIFYSQDLLTDFSGSFPFWGVLRVWEGGMASHGGIMGIIVAAIWYARRHKLDWMNLGDLVTLGGSVGIFAGRIANFINGELYGRPVSGPLSWAVKFPSEAYLWLKYDVEKPITSTNPDLLPRLAGAVEALGASAGMQASQWLDVCSRLRTSAGARNQAQHMIHKLIEATQSGNDAVVQALQPVLTARHPYQLYGALLEGLITFAVVLFAWKKPRKPGVIGGLWISSYAVVRIISEQFRMPDAHIGFQLFGLTRGQWISFGMLAVGIAIFIWALKRNTQPIGGWGKR
jgi:phosphatidylglycerol:prolipoprotein diacylglycerol transferase